MTALDESRPLARLRERAKLAVFVDGLCGPGGFSTHDLVQGRVRRRARQSLQLDVQGVVLAREFLHRSADFVFGLALVHQRVTALYT